MINVDFGDAGSALRAAEAVLDASRQSGMTFYHAVATLFSLWARGFSSDAGAAAGKFRTALTAYFEAGNRVFAPILCRLLADLEALAGDVDAALAGVDRGLEIAQETTEHWWDARLHARRGDILLKRDPSNTRPAEDAYRTAIAVAQEQGARTFELFAALALAKLCQSTGRPVEAHAVLSDALEGFPRSLLPFGRRAGDEGRTASDGGAGALTPDPSPERERGIAPTLEMPEIAEAQALLAALAETNDVKAEAARRETRSKLHAGYALATMMTKGFGAEETKAALKRAASASESARTPEYWTVIYGRINADMMSGDHRSARAGVEAFLAEAEAAGLPGHAAFARRMRGFLKFLAGELAAARMDLEQALADYDEERDERLRTAFAIDFRSNALTFLGQVAWLLGEPEEAKRFTDEAIGRAKDSGQPASYAAARYNRLLIGALCGAAAEVLPAAEEMRAYADQHDLKFWRAMASTYADWARVRLGEPRADAFRAGLAAYADLGARMQEAALLPLLADVELVAGRRDEALAAVERGLALAAETGLGAWRPWLMRKRGEALAETDPAGAASAYREALSVAGAQGSRALALMAALALAKLYQSTGCPADAHAVLAPALEGFAPTSEMPEIAEAQALVERLA